MRQINAASELTEGLTPARLFFVRRLCRGDFVGTGPGLLPERPQRLRPEFPPLPDSTTTEKLRRVQLEFDITCGMFFLLGSVSGWMATSVILFRLIGRMLTHRPASRTDWAFDFLEKVFSREGRRALRLASIMSHRTLQRPALAYLR